jgi:hypothetical protein
MFKNVINGEKPRGKDASTDNRNQIDSSSPSQPGAGTSSNNSRHIEHKSAGVAVILGLIIPGVGQFYAGKMKRGAVILAITYALIIGSWVIQLSINSASTWSLERSLPIIVMMFSGLAVWIYGIMDAADLVSEYNSAIQNTGRAPW